MSAPLTFRSATTADAASIASLWERAGLGSGTEFDQAEIRTRLRNPDGFFVVAERDDAIIAAAMGCHDDHRGWLKRVSVEPDLKGHGIGRAIVAEVERRFLAAGVTKLRLAVWDGNAEGLAFWNSLDYVELTEIHYFAKDLDGAPDDGC